MNPKSIEVHLIQTVKYDDVQDKDMVPFNKEMEVESPDPSAI